VVCGKSPREEDGPDAAPCMAALAGRAAIPRLAVVACELCSPRKALVFSMLRRGQAQASCVLYLAAWVLRPSSQKGARSASEQDDPFDHSSLASMGQMCSQALREAGGAVSGGCHVDESTRGLIMEAMGRDGE
jgi:hypothetical protein